MDTLRIDSGVKRLAINGDESRVIEFNPTDIAFAERFYSLVGEYETKQAEFEKLAKELDRADLDERGLPSNLDAKLALLREVCEFMRAQIDILFGDSASQTIFGDALSLDMFAQFFEQLIPYVKSVRTKKVSKYVKKK